MEREFTDADIGGFAYGLCRTQKENREMDLYPG